MHSILWASILASASVALITTLLVEYLAKPGLEARKERILEDKRQKRATLKDLKRCSMLASELYAWGRYQAVGDGGDEITLAMREKAQKMAAEIDELGSNAYSTIKVPASVNEEWEKAISVVVGYLLVFCPPGRLPRAAWEQYDRAAIRLSYFVELLTTSNWHPLLKRGMLATINSSPLPTYKWNISSEETIASSDPNPRIAR